jgi:hypothetical protein
MRRLPVQQQLLAAFAGARGSWIVKRAADYDKRSHQLGIEES